MRSLFLNVEHSKTIFYKNQWGFAGNFRNITYNCKKNPHKEPQSDWALTLEPPCCKVLATQPLFIIFFIIKSRMFLIFCKFCLHVRNCCLFCISLIDPASVGQSAPSSSASSPVPRPFTSLVSACTLVRVTPSPLFACAKALKLF